MDKKVKEAEIAWAIITGLFVRFVTAIRLVLAQLTPLEIGIGAVIGGLAGIILAIISLHFILRE